MTMAPSAPSAAARSEAPARAGALGAYLQLTKPRITLMVVLTTLVGFLEASAAPRSPALLIQTLIATALLAGSASAFNQVMERRPDALMRRTRSRPLPSGLLTTRQGAWFGAALMLGGTMWLVLAANWLAGALALFTVASYLLAYTPLKQHTWHATVIGAVPGAVPPLIGWAAAAGRLDWGAGALFLIVFLWQLPHFLAIAALFREDYSRAGFRVLPVTDPGGRSTGRQAVLYAAALLPASLAPFALGLAGPVYLAGAAMLSVAFLALSARFLAQSAGEASARALFRFSLLYLPLVLVLVVAA